MKPKWFWLEEYDKCGCTNVTRAKEDALGYCPVHGNDRKYLTPVNGSDLALGYAG